MPCWKTLLRASLCGAYKYTGAMRLHEEAARRAGQQFMTVLLFHRITDAIPEDGLTVGTARFARICRLLRDRFRVVPLCEVHRLLRTGGPVPRRTVAVTFDDCYLDNLAAARVLAEHGLPATFFLPAAFVSTDRVFDWDRGLPRMPNLSWQDARAIAALGHEIGSHSLTHANLGAVGPAAARSEIFASRTMLQEQLGRPVRWFAYPFGGPHHLRPEYLPLIAEAGYEGAFSAFGGFVELGADPRVLPRKAVPAFRSLLHLEAYLSGCLRLLYALKRPLPSPFPAAPDPGDAGRVRASPRAAAERAGA
jgi:peptidoglycan/xylan/chitin deacetylase (PgdA/CDA1 family)